MALTKQDRHEQRAAELCGMSVAEWRAARERSRTERSRGHGRAHRPEPTLWHDVPGQEALFAGPREGDTR